MRLGYIFEIVGVIVITALIIAIPILATCSFFCGWVSILKWGLTLLTIFEWIGLLTFYGEVSE